MTSEKNFKLKCLAVFVSFLVLYVISCAPGLVWQDSGMIQYRVWNNDIEGGLGLALAHPLYYAVLIGIKYVFPFGSFAYKVNLLSAMAGAWAVLNLFVLIKLISKSDLAAFVGAASLGLSHTFWRHCGIPESYDVYVAIFLLELIFVFKYIESRDFKWLCLAGLFNGLSISVHMLGSLPFACYFVFILIELFKKKIKITQVINVALLWLVGCSIYLFLIIKNIVVTGDVISVVKSALFGSSWNDAVMNTSISAKIMLQNVLFFGLNFPSVNILLLFFGLGLLKKCEVEKSFKVIAVVLLVLFLVFAGRYTVVDRYAFFIPFYVMVALFIGIGGNFVFEYFSKNKFTAGLMILLAFTNVIVYQAAPVVAEKVGFNLGTRGDVPYRDDSEWFLRPWRSGYYGADRFAEEALASVEDGAIIYSDGTLVYPLLLKQQVEGVRGDVFVANTHGSADNLYDVSGEMLLGRDVYTTGKLPEKWEQVFGEYELVKVGHLFKVVRR